MSSFTFNLHFYAFVWTGCFYEKSVSLWQRLMATASNNSEGYFQVTPKTDCPHVQVWTIGFIWFCGTVNIDISRLLSWFIARGVLYWLPHILRKCKKKIQFSQTSASCSYWKLCDHWRSLLSVNAIGDCIVFLFC